ncbi:MAG: hypothetical protein COU25_03520 [Candidatus Levybacteria bacterium CG10_big_fil_rev_8_21_14_0_10_35_13]|nr:MAG: hypothetical protein COU25_03520 [Candidatus Levybacteria bacterium CG10_big_fil_rev_8_21_14_0_10_35_13]
MEQFNFLIGPAFTLFLIKIFFLAVSALFIIFLIVVVRQVYSMNTIVHDIHDEFIIKSAAIILFIISLSLFLTALVIL